MDDAVKIQIRTTLLQQRQPHSDALNRDQPFCVIHLSVRLLVHCCIRQIRSKQFILTTTTKTI